jgi:hypothetical protein
MPDIQVPIVRKQVLAPEVRARMAADAALRARTPVGQTYKPYYVPGITRRAIGAAFVRTADGPAGRPTAGPATVGLLKPEQAAALRQKATAAVDRRAMAATQRRAAEKREADRKAGQRQTAAVLAALPADKLKAIAGDAREPAYTRFVAGCFARQPAQDRAAREWDRMTAADRGGWADRETYVRGVVRKAGGTYKPPARAEGEPPADTPPTAPAPEPVDESSRDYKRGYADGKNGIDYQSANFESGYAAGVAERDPSAAPPYQGDPGQVEPVDTESADYKAGLTNGREGIDVDSASYKAGHDAGKAEATGSPITPPADMPPAAAAEWAAMTPTGRARWANAATFARARARTLSPRRR